MKFWQPYGSVAVVKLKRILKFDSNRFPFYMPDKFKRRNYSSFLTMPNLRFINNVRVNNTNSIINHSCSWHLNTMRQEIERQNVFYNYSTLSGYMKIKPNSNTKSFMDGLNLKSCRHIFTLLSEVTSSPYTDFKTAKFNINSGSYHLSTLVVLTLNKSDTLYCSHISNYKQMSTRNTRYVKSSKKLEQEFEDDDEEEEDRDDENEAAKDYKDIKANLNSLRLDVILKHGLGMSRSKAEEAFYESRIRVNGEKILKKSAQVQVGNEIDLIKGINSKNENFLDISRVIVQRIESRGETEKMSVVLRRFKNMVIENYDTPWNHSKED